MKIVVLSPHRGDAAFSLSLAIGEWIEAKHTVVVLNCFTRSDYAPFSDAPSLHPNDRMSYVSALRRREDETWARQFGSHLNVVDLNLKDAPLRLHCAPEQVCSLPVKADDKALAKTYKALVSLKPDALVVPLALGAHVDHLTARDGALQFLHDPFSAELACAFYEDLPYAARPGAAEQIEAAAQVIDPFSRAVFTDGPREAKTATARKRKLALCYDSQIDDAVCDQIAEFCTQYQGRERLWANPAWQASALVVADETV